MSKNQSVMRYAGMATQMAVTIGLAVWGGIRLDAYQQNDKPVWTVILSLSGVLISMYAVIKDLIKK